MPWKRSFIKFEPLPSWSLTDGSRHEGIVVSAKLVQYIGFGCPDVPDVWRPMNLVSWASSNDFSKVYGAVEYLLISSW